MDKDVAGLVWWLGDAAQILQANGTTYHAEKAREAASTIRALDANLREAVEVMWTLYHAACGPTGFAAAVRATSKVPYPWPALDEADDLARAFLADMEKPRDP